MEYIYPLKSDRKSASTLEEFRITAKIKSRLPINNLYSPSHNVTVNRLSEHDATVQFEDSAVRLDRDFQLYLTSSSNDIGVTAIQHRPVPDEDGYVMLLLSPRSELSRTQRVPRDIVFVVDTSGSMRTDDKMKQAKDALGYCLKSLSLDDRFAVISFASTVSHYRERLVNASPDHIDNCIQWVEKQRPGGGTAIHSALMSALEMQDSSSKRMFTVAFFTDGQPTIGETNTDKILDDLNQIRLSGTRIFSFGLGDDLNAVFLDQVAEQTRAISSYVRPNQNITNKVSSFFQKINHPVLANLQLKMADDKVRLSEVYPPHLPDLFHGDQLVVLARYQGDGQSGFVLSGSVGDSKHEFKYDVLFAAKQTQKVFVEEIWARRKVGYLLDQIRINGEQIELVDEVVALSKRYGITTPYTSYLIMPDVSTGLALGGRSSSGMKIGGGDRFGGGGGFGGRGYTPLALIPRSENHPQRKVVEIAREIQDKPGGIAAKRDQWQNQSFNEFDASGKRTTRNRAEKSNFDRLANAKKLKNTLDRAKANFQRNNLIANQVSELGVELSQSTQRLKHQQTLETKAVRNVANRKCMEYGGVWIDEEFSANSKTVAVRAQSDAYFQILKRFPRMKEVFQLGNHIVWISPNGTALIIDTTDGKEKMSDREIDLLFARK